jgi:hypothetical protein
MAAYAFLEERTNERLMLAPSRRVAGVDRARVAVIASHGDCGARVSGAIRRAFPIDVAFTFVRTDALAMAAAVPHPTAVVDGALDRSDVLPSGVASARVGPYAGAVVAGADVAAMELVALLAFPSAFAEAQALERAAHPVLALAIRLAVAVLVFVLVIVGPVAVVVLVLLCEESIPVDVVVLAVCDAIAIGVGIFTVVQPVAVNVRVVSVWNSVIIKVAALGCVEWIGPVMDFVDVLGSIAVAVT